MNKELITILVFDEEGINSSYIYGIYDSLEAIKKTINSKDLKRYRYKEFTVNEGCDFDWYEAYTYEELETYISLEKSFGY